MHWLDLIRVHSLRPGRHRAVMLAAGASLQAAVGRSGITRCKREGDGASPAGTWPLRHVLYRADRIARPKTGLPVQALSTDDGWCDCREDRRYNRPVKLPYGASAEALWRDDGVYDILVVLGYNDDPPHSGLGSAIFLHLAEAHNAPTAGCVAVSRRDMVRLLTRCGPMTHLQIGA